MSKYLPLQEHLKSLQIELWHVSFAELEDILHVKLPKSARNYREWWANNPTGHSHCKSWVVAGWRTEKVNMLENTLVFRKLVGESQPVPGVSGVSGSSDIDLWGWLKGTVTILGDHDITLPVDDNSWNAMDGLIYEE